MFRRAIGVIVMNVNERQPSGIAMLLADRVVNVDVDFSGLTTLLTSLDGEGD